MPIPSPIVVDVKNVDDNSGRDDYGYEEVVKPNEIKTEVAAVVDDTQVEKKATGYEKDLETKPDENKAAPVAEAKADVPATDEEKLKQELSEVLKGLPESLNKERVTKFALDHKLTKEQLTAYSEMVKNDDKIKEDKDKEFVATQRREWKNDLVNDKEFGGENFDKNVDRVEKVLQNYMSNTKKILTERGSMLPPYIMRDLLSISKVLNPTTTLVSGEPPKAAQDSNNYLEEMYS